ncbi:1014_t:CDS:2 [Entrophospora sp. SA101]|nr:1014_t:CDS:2 [Entrophospora sp. SA101]
MCNAQEYYFAKSQKGENYRLHVAKSKHLVGLSTTRGIRETNEDRCQVMVLELNEDKLKQFAENIVQDKVESDIDIINAVPVSRIEVEEESKEGHLISHGGPECADFLTTNLHNRIEEVAAKDADDVVVQWHETNKTNLPESSLESKKTLTLEQRLTLAFLKTDLELLNGSGNTSGSTASIVIVKPLDHHPFWNSQKLEITVAHVGDTRILMCDVPSGKVIRLTDDHHPSATTENSRLQRSGGYIITDSFGAEMFLGKLAVSRSMGDSKMKIYGVSAEPDIKINTVIGMDTAFLVLVSDGVTSVMSDQEIVDCIKGCNDPTVGASKLVNFAEELGSEDNITAMVIRFPGWGSEMPDHTKDLRKYRLENESRAHNRRT